MAHAVVIQVKIDPDSGRSTDTRYSMTSYFLKQGRYLGVREGNMDERWRWLRHLCRYL
jgi:hypothetical protein